MSKLTVVIPTYNRAAYLAECLESIAAQTLRDFEIVVLDNASTDDTQAVVARFDSLGIRYIRNERNIGGVRNLSKARQIGSSSEYHVVFHDDDLMHPSMLERQLAALEGRPEVAWIATESSPFADSSEPLSWAEGSEVVEFLATQDALVRLLLDNVPLNFGSVMYRTASSATAGFRLEEFEIIADRVLLCDIAEAGPVALIRERMVLYRHHATQGSHDPVFREDHALNLMRYYRTLLPQPLTDADAALLSRHATNYLLHARAVIAPANRMPIRQLMGISRAEGLFVWSAIDGQGVAALASLVGLGAAYGAVRPALGRLKRAVLK